MTEQRILVTGASGYIAGQLVPRLLQAGHTVRCMVRDPQKIAHQPWAGEVDVAAADVLQPATLGAALDQIETAYYLIHNMSSGHGYQKVELEGARNFARAAHQAGVKHIIYLGGLADLKAKIAPHMRSRIETGEVLREHAVPVTEFRAGVIVGPGSISFEMIRFLCEQLPVLIGPSWLENRTQPISSENVVDYLIAALENQNGRGEVFEIGGPERYTYGETMLLYGQARQLKRRLIILPTLPTALMAYFVDKLTPVPAAIAYPLIEGLNSDSIITDPKAQQVFPEVRLCGYRESVDHSLTLLHPGELEPLWLRQGNPHLSLKSEGFLIEAGHLQVAKPAEAVFAELIKNKDEYAAGFELEDVLEPHRILFRAENMRRGDRWVEWMLSPQSGSTTHFQQTGFFAPRGLGGFASNLVWKNQQRQMLRKLKRLLV